VSLICLLLVCPSCPSALSLIPTHSVFSLTLCMFFCTWSSLPPSFLPHHRTHRFVTRRTNGWFDPIGSAEQAAIDGLGLTQIVSGMRDGSISRFTLRMAPVTLLSCALPSECVTRHLRFEYQTAVYKKDTTRMNACGHMRKMLLAGVHSCTPARLHIT
jgi:hypothetical protein